MQGRVEAIGIAPSDSVCGSRDYLCYSALFMSTPLHNSELVGRASELARTAHAGQFRRDGVTPYATHPEAVARRVAGDETAEAVAWLHDVLEDTAITVDDLRNGQIPEEVISSVVLLTNKGDIGYERYLAQIKSNTTAKKV